MVQTTLTAPKIKCEGCAQTITQALTPVPGVEQVAVDVARKQVTVSYDPGTGLEVEQLRTKLTDAGFPPA